MVMAIMIVFMINDDNESADDLSDHDVFHQLFCTYFIIISSVIK